MAERRREHEQRIPWWPIGLSVALVAALLIGMLVLLPFYGRSEYQVGRWDVAPNATQVKFHGQVWVPASKPVTKPDTKMAAVDRTDDGHFLYVEGPADLSGGGGGRVYPHNPQVPGRQVYLRVGDGQYVPLKKR